MIFAAMEFSAMMIIEKWVFYALFSICKPWRTPGFREHRGRGGEGSGILWMWALLEFLEQCIFLASSPLLRSTAIVPAIATQCLVEDDYGFLAGQCPSSTHGYAIHCHTPLTVLHKLKTFAAGSSKAADHIYLSPYLSFVSGALAGCGATVGLYPFDLLRTLLANQGEPKVYPNMRSTFLGIIRNRGFQGLYAGLSPTLVDIIPYAGLQFGTYDMFKRWTVVKFEPTTSWALLRSDVIGQSKYTCRIVAAKDIFREEGLPGFWRGNVPALLMVMPYNAIQFTVLHKLKTFAAGSSKAGFSGSP